MAVVIRFARHGRKRNPFYRVVAADSQSSRDGRYLEVLGTYNPKDPNNVGNIKFDRVDHWLGLGAQPSSAAKNLFKRTKKQEEAQA